MYLPLSSRTAVLAGVLSLAGAGVALGQTYAYDALGRIKTTTRATSSSTYTYDAADNIISVAGTGSFASSARLESSQLNGVAAVASDDENTAAPVTAPTPSPGDVEPATTAPAPPTMRTGQANAGPVRPRPS
jgi:hypothetical protein